MLNRRALLTGLIAAPLVAKATNLMPIRIPITRIPVIPVIPVTGLGPCWLPCDGRELLTRQYKQLAKIINVLQDDDYKVQLIPTNIVP